MLETTWHTPTGWVIVWDLLVMGPAPTDERRDRYRRVPGDTMGQGTLLRIATCCDGRVEVQTNCVPQFDYGRENGEWTYDDGGYEKVTCRYGDLALDLTGSMRLGILGPRTYGRTTLEEGESAWLALVLGRRRADDLGRGGQRSATRPRSTGATGSRWRRSTTTRGARTSSGARSRSSR